MKIFKLKTIKYKNVMSVGDDVIEIQLGAHHKTLITGTNGTGKSTMLEAITFALFGRPFRDIKKGQLINSVTKKNMWVELVMEYDSHEYVIRRGQKPTVFEILKDGVPLNEAASAADFQREFEEMIGMNYNSYKQVVVLGTAGYTPFMGLKTPERRKLVEDLLEVSVLADMDKANKDEIKLINTELAQIDLKITHNQTQTQTLINADERQKKLSGDNVQRFEDMLQEKHLEIEGLKSSTKALNEQILQIILPDESILETQSNAHRKVVSIEGEVNQMTRVLKLYSAGGSCPTCLQQLSDQSLITKVEDRHAELTQQFNEARELHTELHAKKVELLNAKEQVNKLENQIKQNRAIGATVVEAIRKINAALEESKKEFVDNTKEIDRLKSEHVALVDTKSKLLVDKQQRMIITEMLKDGGIKGSIIKKYLPVFNRQINKYLSLLEADYSFTLNEEFSETITSRGREDFSYASFSQGEKGRIDLALMFTWRDIAEKISGVKISCLFLDEVFDGAFDASATKSVTTILNTMSDANIFIISHRDHNPQDYGQHLHMKKVGRFTVLEQ